MKKNLGLIFFILFLGACSQPSPAQSNESKQLTVVWAIRGTEVMKTSVAGLLTASALPIPATITDTPTLIPPTLMQPTDTLSPIIPTLTAPVDLPTTESSITTLTPFPTRTVTPQSPCYQVVDPWCSNHQGCSTLSVYNKTTTDALISLRNSTFGVNTTLKIPPTQIAGICTLVLQPGNYFYEFNYCDRVDKGNHPLNDNWYILFKCQ